MNPGTRAVGGTTGLEYLVAVVLQEGWLGWFRATLLASGLCAAMTSAHAAGIKLPGDGDEYSALVAKAMTHDQSVDFTALRFAFLKSEARQRAHSGTIVTLRDKLVKAVSAADPSAVRDYAEQILSLDFTNLLAHKFLRQSCVLLHDDACAELHHFIEFGLLASITTHGDGKTCATGWPVVAISEEYFILELLETTLKRQALVSGGGHSCDVMTVVGRDGATQVYYFNADAVLADEAAMFDHK